MPLASLGTVNNSRGYRPQALTFFHHINVLIMYFKKKVVITNKNLFIPLMILLRTNTFKCYDKVIGATAHPFNHRTWTWDRGRWISVEFE